LNRESSLVAVCGRRRERFPSASIYNRIIDLEWDTPIGHAACFGGDALVLVRAFREAGGFDESVAAGEEPELCERLRQKGGRIARIDADMTLHDAAVFRFSQWWKRHLRSGYGGLDVQRRKNVPLFNHELRSARRWTFGWLTLTLILSGVLAWLLGLLGLMLGAAIGTSVWLLQVTRVARSFMDRGLSPFDAFKAGLITMFVKWANVVGQLRYLQDARTGRVSRMIEYKSRTPVVSEACSVR
jgi:hypothetical protein